MKQNETPIVNKQVVAMQETPEVKSIKDKKLYKVQKNRSLSKANKNTLVHPCGNTEGQ